MKVALRLPSSDAIKYPKEVGGCKKEKGERAKSRRHGKKKKKKHGLLKCISMCHFDRN